MYISTFSHAKKYSMPVKQVPVYVNDEGTSVYSVFVTSTGIPNLYLPCDGRLSYRLYESTMNQGFCVATTEQVNALATYISRHGLSDPDMMAYPDNSPLPPVIERIMQNGHAYDVGTVMIGPDFARFYIRRSDVGTIRLVYFSKTQLARPQTLRR